MQKFENISEELYKELSLYIEVTTYYRFHNDCEIANHVFEKVNEQINATTFIEVSGLWRSVFNWVEEIGTLCDEKRVVKRHHDYNKYVRAGRALIDEQQIDFHADPMTREEVTEAHDWKRKMGWLKPRKRNGVFYYEMQDLFNLHETNLFRIHFDLPTKGARRSLSDKKLNETLCNIGSKVVETLQKCKLNASWDGLPGSPIEIHDIAWYNITKDSKMNNPRDYPNKLLSKLMHLIERSPPGTSIPYLYEELDTGENVMITSVKRALLNQPEYKIPPKKPTKRKVAKDLINSVLTQLRRNGFVATDVQVDELYAYWEEETEAITSKMQKMEEALETGKRKSLPALYVTYDRSHLKNNQIELSCGFVNREESYFYMPSHIAKGGGKIEDVTDSVMEEFKKKGFHVDLPHPSTPYHILITNFGDMVAQKME